MIDFGIAGTRRSLEDIRIGCQDMTPAGAKYAQRNLHCSAIKVSLGVFQIRRNAFCKQSQEDRLENVFRIVGAAGDGTGSAVHQLMLLPKDFLNPWDCPWLHL